MQLEEDRVQSAHVATVIQSRRAAWLNRHLKKKVFKTGDVVLVYNSKLGKHPEKLRLRYVGPYRILRDLGQGTFVVTDLKGQVVIKPINGFRLKPYFQRIEDAQINLVMAFSVKEKGLNDVEGVSQVGNRDLIIIKEEVELEYCATCATSRFKVTERIQNLHANIVHGVLFLQF